MLPFSQAVNAAMRSAHVIVGAVQVRVVVAVVATLVPVVALVIVRTSAQSLLRRGLVVRTTVFAEETHKDDELPR